MKQQNLNISSNLIPKNEYQYPAELKHDICSSATFSHLEIPKELLFDIEEEYLIMTENGKDLKNQWGTVFAKQFIPIDLLNWLKEKDFFLTADYIKSQTRVVYNICFQTEADRLHYLLKFSV